MLKTVEELISLYGDRLTINVEDLANGLENKCINEHYDIYDLAEDADLHTVLSLKLKDEEQFGNYLYEHRCREIFKFKEVFDRQHFRLKFYERLKLELFPVMDMEYIEMAREIYEIYLDRLVNDVVVNRITYYAVLSPVVVYTYYSDLQPIYDAENDIIQRMFKAWGTNTELDKMFKKVEEGERC